MANTPFSRPQVTPDDSLITITKRMIAHPHSAVNVTGCDFSGDINWPFLNTQAFEKIAPNVTPDRVANQATAPTVTIGVLPQPSALAELDGDGLHRVRLDRDGQRHHNLETYCNMSPDFVLKSRGLLPRGGATDYLPYEPSTETVEIKPLHFGMPFEQSEIKISSVDVDVRFHG